MSLINIEADAWKLSDTLSKTIEYLYKTDLTQAVRRKMIRDILKNNFVNFYKKNHYEPGSENDTKEAS